MRLELFAPTFFPAAAFPAQEFWPEKSMAGRPQPVVLDVHTETLMEEAVLNVTTFFEQLLHVPEHGWSLTGGSQSKQRLQQADRIIDALL